MKLDSRLAVTAALAALVSLSAVAIAAGAPIVRADGTAIAGMDKGTPNQQIDPPAPGDTDWPSYNRRLDGQRFSELDQINAQNVANLEEGCRVRVGGPGPFNSGLLLVDGALYFTTSRATMAVNPINCDIVWKALYVPQEREVFVHNRGIAHADGKLFRGTGDARLVAYDAKSGNEIWRKKVGDPAFGQFISAAPIAWQGIVFVGLSGGDWGMQGRMMAFDAKSGEQLWSFNTIPGPGEFGNETWAGDSWKTGGGATWSSYALDEEAGELFVPVANPSPDLNPAVRRGDNLFTNAMVVLDAKTGKRLWHYQARKNDNHDYGITPPAVLLTLKNGRKVVAQASKDGFVYLIDRKTHKLIYKTAVTTIFNHDVDPTPEGVKVCPGMTGGVEYNSPGYDPVNNALTVGAVDWCSILMVEHPPVYKQGEIYLGGSFKQDGLGSGWITSLDAATGKVRWNFHSTAPVVAGVTPTAGGITFAGDMGGTLYAFRSSDGEILKRIETGGAIAGGIITYKIRGVQYVAITSGNISRSTWPQASGIPSLVVYRLGDGTAPSASGAPKAAPAAVAAAAVPGNPTLGKGTFANMCSSCHGADGEGLVGTRLKGIAARYDEAQVAEIIKHPKSPMPAFYPSILSSQQVADVAAFVRTLE